MLTLRTTLPSVTYPNSESKILAFQNLEKALTNRPEVESAGFIYDIPLASDHQGTTVAVQGQPVSRSGEEPHTNFTFATPGYFDAMGIKVLNGRGFTDDDTKNTRPVVVLNQAAAKMLFGSEEAVGRSLYIGFNSDIARQITGVVQDVRINQLKEDPPATVYVPYYQVPWSGSMSLAVRTRMEPAAATATVRGTIQETVPGLPLYDIKTMEQIVSESLSQPEFAAIMLTLFSSTALILACIGLYGFVSFLVAQRTREIGIRMALGAQRLSIFRLILNHGLKLGIYGIVAGVAGSLILTRLLSGLLFGITPSDPATLVGFSALFIAVVAAACMIPAQRATRVDPLVALKQE